MGSIPTETSWDPGPLCYDSGVCDGLHEADVRFERYVAIGDSSTEGLDDPDGNGGYRGWANRLAETIPGQQGSLL